MKPFEIAISIMMLGIYLSLPIFTWSVLKIESRISAIEQKQPTAQPMRDVYKRDCGQLKPIYCLYERGVWHGEKRNG